MSERQRSIGRIVALQTKMKTLAAAQLARAEGAKAAIVATRTDLETFMAGADLTGALAVHAITRAKALAAHEAEAEKHRAAAMDKRRAAETKLKLAERLGEAVAREEAARGERRALERLIEDAVGRPPGDDVA